MPKVSCLIVFWNFKIYHGLRIDAIQEELCPSVLAPTDAATSQCLCTAVQTIPPGTQSKFLSLRVGGFHVSSEKQNIYPSLESSDT